MSQLESSHLTVFSTSDHLDKIHTKYLSDADLIGFKYSINFTIAICKSLYCYSHNQSHSLLYLKKCILQQSFQSNITVKLQGGISKFTIPGSLTQHPYFFILSKDLWIEN